MATMRTWHVVHDIATKVRYSVLGTTFHPPTEDFPTPTVAARLSTTFEFSRHSIPLIARRLYLTSQPPGKVPDYTEDSNIGILSSVGSRRPGSGFLRGSSKSEAVLARSTSLISSLTSTFAQPFYSSLKGLAKLDRPAVTALSTDAMLYSPSVVGLRRDDADHFDMTDDDFDGELDAIPADPTTKDLEVPLAINAQNQRAMGEYVAPYVMNVLSAVPVHAGAFRSASYMTPEWELNGIVRGTMKSRIARALRLFAARGNSTLVLCAFGCEEGTPIDVVAQIYAELLACSTKSEDVNDGEFKDIFQKVIFAVPGKLHAMFRKTFEMRVYEDELIRSLEIC
ncbi:hypothetical protein B0F90DRAFT_1718230 [Multifurca ochricompacta]|uniref:Microbial-type PARG catalytic domain-containing protein n=1 Tax=Multifurca ochricompacta TaxID=376703 RepID=A0AAD4M4I7_9AGAM|nr:hypothetical protein B0F90DRAFT_1718230 [Multifurca ochricompacta]